MTLLNVKAKNHPQQVRRRGADDATDDRRTPDDLWRQWHERFRFTVDAAASHENAKLPAFFCLPLNDALQRPWNWHNPDGSPSRVWCNPSYSNVGAWVEKAWAEWSCGHCELIVMLVPANRTEQGWWQDHVERYRDGNDRRPGATIRVEFLRGRMRFDRPGWTKPAKGDRPPFGLCLLIWERDA